LLSASLLSSLSKYKSESSEELLTSPKPLSLAVLLV
jgi:hypothetical protein